MKKSKYKLGYDSSGVMDENFTESQITVGKIFYSINVKRLSKNQIGKLFYIWLVVGDKIENDKFKVVINVKLPGKVKKEKYELYRHEIFKLITAPETWEVDTSDKEYFVVDGYSDGIYRSEDWVRSKYAVPRGKCIYKSEVPIDFDFMVRGLVALEVKESGIYNLHFQIYKWRKNERTRASEGTNTT